MQYTEQPGIIYPTLCKLYQAYKAEGFSLIIIVLLLAILCKKNKSSLATCVTTKDIFNHNEIEKILKQMLTILDCDRIAIGIFHNSELLPLTTMSVLYEVCKEGVTPKKDSMLNLPILNLQSEIKNLNPFKFLKFSITQSNLTPSCARYLQNKGVHTKYCRLLANKEGAYGIMEMHYLTEPSFDFLTNPLKVSMIRDCFKELKTLLKEANITSTTL